MSSAMMQHCLNSATICHCLLWKYFCTHVPYWQFIGSVSWPFLPTVGPKKKKKLKEITYHWLQCIPKQLWWLRLRFLNFTAKHFNPLYSYFVTSTALNFSETLLLQLDFCISCVAGRWCIWWQLQNRHHRETLHRDTNLLLTTNAKMQCLHRRQRIWQQLLTVSIERDLVFMAH